MKKLLLLFSCFSILSCASVLELNGNWIVEEIIHYGVEIYPNTVSENIQLSIDPAGYEGAEKISFDSKNLKVMFPGMESNMLEAEYKIQSDSITFYQESNNRSIGEEYVKTKEVFLQKFEIIKFPRKEILGLKSSSTIIKLINEDYLFEKGTNEFFNKLNNTAYNSGYNSSLAIRFQ